MHRSNPSDTSQAVDESGILKLDFLDKHFQGIQAEAAQLASLKARKEYAASLKSLLKKFAKQIQIENQQFNLSSKAAWEILRRKHILFLTRYAEENWSDGIKQFVDSYIDTRWRPYQVLNLKANSTSENFIIAISAGERFCQHFENIRSIT